MKKIFFVIATLIVVILTQAGNHTIVVRGDSIGPKGKTEVFVGNTVDSDSIIVFPSQEVSDICVTVKSVYGDILDQCVLSAKETNEIEISTPDLSEGCIIEIEDNSGVVYTDVE